jgi:peptide methionine sulfoxide reductase MsrA
MKKGYHKGQELTRVRAGTIAGRVERPTTGVVCSGRSKTAEPVEKPLLNSLTRRLSEV